MQADGRNKRDQDPGELLISDADRDQLSAVLGEHMAEGRLTADELDQRVGRLLESRTRAQAAAVMADLPPLDEPERPRHFHLGHEDDDEPRLAVPDWLSAGGPTDVGSLAPNPPAARPPLAPVPSQSRAAQRAADRKRVKQHADEDAIGHAFQSRRRALTAELERASASHDRDEVRRLSESLREAKETAAAAHQAAASGNRAEAQRLLQRLRGG